MIYYIIENDIKIQIGMSLIWYVRKKENDAQPFFNFFSIF